MAERRRPLKVAEVTSVDYSLRNFLLPLMRGARERGHEVVGVCADGPLLDLPRAEGFRIVPVPMVRSLDPRAQGRAFRALLVQLIAQAGGWAGFALASQALAQAAGRGPEWPHFIAAWNWANVVQYLLLLAVSVPAMLGLPGALASALALATLGYQLWLVFFLARTTLGSRGLAMAMLGLDLLVGVTVEALLAALSS